MKHRRAGFTLVELLVGIVVGAFVLAVSLRVLMMMQGVFEVQDGRIQNQQALRTGLDLLSTELRALSGPGTDIVEMKKERLKVRSMDRFGIVCSVDADVPHLVVRTEGRRFEVGDSIVVFADGDPQLTTDDTWLFGTVSASDTTETCGGETAQTLVVNDMADSLAARPAWTGAPVSSWTHHTYEMEELNGQYYLAKRGPDGVAVPLCGPFSEDKGVEFKYRDEKDEGTNKPEEVAQIHVILRTERFAEGGYGGAMYEETVETRVSLRN